MTKLTSSTARMLPLLARSSPSRLVAKYILMLRTSTTGSAFSTSRAETCDGAAESFVWPFGQARSAAYQQALVALPEPTTVNEGASSRQRSPTEAHLA